MEKMFYLDLGMENINGTVGLPSIRMVGLAGPRRQNTVKKSLTVCRFNIVEYSGIHPNIKAING